MKVCQYPYLLSTGIYTFWHNSAAETFLEFSRKSAPTISVFNVNADLSLISVGDHFKRIFLSFVALIKNNNK